jgi:hypothetical protein
MAIIGVERNTQMYKAIITLENETKTITGDTWDDIIEELFSLGILKIVEIEEEE